MDVKLSSAKTMSEADLATAVPEPMAIPISAFFKAGASLTPSPVYNIELIFLTSKSQNTHHSSDILVLLKIFDNLRFVGGFDTGKASGTLAGNELLIRREIIEFTSSVSFSVGFFIGIKDSDFLADSNGGILEVNLNPLFEKNYIRIMDVIV